MTHPLTIWWFDDSKPGHVNQTRGLIDAMQQLNAVETCRLKPQGKIPSLLNLITGRFPPGKMLPAPDLLIGAGHHTHLSLLAARRAYGGKTIVLMRPSLPTSSFDFCLIPEHDAPPQRDNIIVTQGALNKIKVNASYHKNPDLGLMMIGGPSSHAGWSNQVVYEQISALCNGSPNTQWQLTTSRRTPGSFLDHLQTRPTIKNLTVTAFQDTDENWVTQQLNHCSTAWITEDSVSMVYEVLTAGCACGIISLPDKRHTRVMRGLEQLNKQQLIITFQQWQQGIQPSAPKTPFNEAQRCAQLIYHRLNINNG